MTSVRQSHVFALERKFRAGKDDSDSWITTPPGSFIQHTQQRTTSRINSSGSKFFDTYAYGKMAGTWNWSFTLDYNYIEPLLLAFETYTHTEPSTGKHVHSFTKKNNCRVPSFTIRTKVLHRIAGNDDKYPDEIVILKGCVCQKISFSQSAGKSQMSVSMSGFYCDEEQYRVNLESTDYTEYECKDGLTEYFCLFTDTVSDDTYVANTLNLSVGLSTGADPIPNVCSPFATQFRENQVKCEIGTSIYANDPKVYKERMFRGGRTSSTEKSERNGTGAVSSVYDNLTGYRFKPMSKGLAPLEHMYMVSYNKSCHDDPASYGSSIKSAIDASSRRFEFSISKVVMNSASWAKGDNSELYDQLNSVECRQVAITITNSTGAITEAPSTGVTRFATHKLPSSASASTVPVAATLNLVNGVKLTAYQITALTDGYIVRDTGGNTVPGLTFESHVVNGAFASFVSGTPSVTYGSDETSKTYRVPYFALGSSTADPGRKVLEVRIAKPSESTTEPEETV